MATSSVPSLQFTSTGITLPLESDILAGTLADMNAAFGGNMNLSLTTPQGQYASSEAAIIGDANNQIAAMANQFNPFFAFGRMQDALGAIYFLNRLPAESTVLTVACVGGVGVNIATGAQVIDPNGNIYQCTGGALIPSGGTINLQFACLVTGLVPVPGSVMISQAIPGWDTATLVSGVEGSEVEGQSEFEARRAASVALNATGALQAIKANVLNVPGVLDAYVTENTTNAAITVGPTSYSLLPHSIYVAAIGGDSTAIATAIWIRKSMGADYNGNTSVVIFDTNGYMAPYPSYTVKFEIPPALPIHFAVSLSNNGMLPSTIVTLVKNAIINAFAGGDGGPRARIGATLFASRFYAPVALISPNVEIISILIGTSTATLTSVPVGIDQEPTVIAANISVTLV